MHFLQLLLQEKELAQSLNDFIAYGLILIEHHRILFPPRKRLATAKLDYLLRYACRIILYFVLSRQSNKVFKICCLSIFFAIFIKISGALLI